MRNAFDRDIIRLLEVVEDFDGNRLQSLADRSLRFALRELLARGFGAHNPKQVLDGFVGDGFRVVPAGGMTVNVTAGLAFLDRPTGTLADDVGAIVQDYAGITGLDDLERWKAAVAPDAVGPFTVDAVGVPENGRIDIVELRCPRRTMDSVTPRFLTPPTTIAPSGSPMDKTLTALVDSSVNVVTSPTDSVEPLSYKKGVEAGSPAVPATTAGYAKLCEIHVSGSTTSIDWGNLMDWRSVLLLGGVAGCPVAFTIPADDTSAPSDLMLAAPPGIEVYVVAAGSGHAGELDVFVLHRAASYASLALSPTLLGGTVVALPCVTGPFFELLDSGQVGRINSSLNAAGAVPVHVGTAATRFHVKILSQDSGNALFDTQPGSGTLVTGTLALGM